MTSTSQILHYRNWLNTAKRLFASSKIIFSSFQVRYNRAEGENTLIEDSEELLGLMLSYMLVISFAVENLLKGYSIFEYQKSKSLDSFKSVKDLENVLWGSKKSHDLNAIALSGNLEIVDTEKEMLKRLERYSIWAGRYHTPRNEHEIHELMKGKYEFKIISADQKLISNLFSKIEKSIFG